MDTFLVICIECSRSVFLYYLSWITILRALSLYEELGLFFPSLSKSVSISKLSIPSSGAIILVAFSSAMLLTPLFVRISTTVFLVYKG